MSIANRNQTHLQSMSLKEMFINDVLRPFLEAFSGLFSHLKALSIAWGATTLAAANDLFEMKQVLGLFEVPVFFLAALIILVVSDWVGGVINAIRDGRFDVRIAVRKWYHIAAYFFVCGNATVLANLGILTFGGGSPAGIFCFYFQFLVYATFAVKEFMSILRSWNALPLMHVVWEMALQRDFSVDAYRRFKKEVERQDKTSTP